MGWTSEMVAEHYKVSRETQDEYALISHTRANEVCQPFSITVKLGSKAPQALKNGILSDEIIPIELRGKTITQDDTIRPGVSRESLASLKPVFADWGVAATTAGNASGIGDGAGIVILTTRENAQKEGLPILGKWVGSSVVGEFGGFFSIRKSELTESCRCASEIHGNITHLCHSSTS